MTRMNVIGRKPLDIMDVESEFGFCLDPRLNFVLEDLAIFPVKFFGENSYDPITPVALEREENDE